MPSYNIKTTAEQREIIDVALKNQKKLAQDAYSLLKRLGKSEAPATEAQGAVEYLMDTFKAMNIGERDAKDWEINQQGAEQLRAALVNFSRQAAKQNESAHQFTLMTDLSKKTKAVQDVFDQVSEQLNFGLMPIGAAVEEMNAKPPRTDEDGEDGDLAKDDGVQPAPHRGRRSSAGSDPLVLADGGAKSRVARPPRTAGAKTMAMMGRGRRKK
jgi:hypothetical protein